MSCYKRILGFMKGESVESSFKVKSSFQRGWRTSPADWDITPEVHR